MKTGTRINSLLAALFAIFFITACGPKKNVSPELLEGPGWTSVDNNLHQIDGPSPGQPERAFRVYRSGSPSKETFAKWCGEYGIERVIVMSGNAASHELEYQAEGVCKDIEVIYDLEQKVGTPVSDGFLEFFEEEVKKAKDDGVGLLFRCHTGSHRAGRTAAYYQMKYQGMNAEDAIVVMDYNGMMMPLFDPALRPQVRAMSDYISGKPCSQEAKSCVAENSDRYMP